MKGIGIDLCCISRMEKNLNERFLGRCFTQEERAYIASRAQAGAQSAAALWAAKEAFLKASGAGLGGGIHLQEIGVTHAPDGAPSYALTGAAEEKMKQMGALHAFLSITHEGDMAACVCVIE